MVTRRRREPVTKEQVFAFIEEYIGQHDEVPKQQLIVEELGGSLTTIGKYVREWQQTFKNDARTTIEMPEQIRQASIKIGEQWWSIAESYMANTIKLIQDSSAKAVAEANENFQTYLAECERLERLEEEQALNLEQATKELTELKAEIVLVRERLQKSELKNESDAEIILRLEEHLNQFKDFHSDALAQVTKVYEERLKVADEQLSKFSISNS